MVTTNDVTEQAVDALRASVGVIREQVPDQRVATEAGRIVGRGVAPDSGHDDAADRAAQEAAWARFSAEYGGGDDGRLSLSDALPASALTWPQHGRSAPRCAPPELLARVQQSGGEDYVRAALTGSALSGVGAELNAELGMPERGVSGGVKYPLVAAAAASMHGQRVSLTALATSSADVYQSGPISTPIRNMPVLARIGVNSMMVSEGEQRFTRVKTEPEVVLPSEDTAVTAGTSALEDDVLKPKRWATATQFTVESLAVAPDNAAVFAQVMMSAGAQTVQTDIVKSSLFALGTAPDDATSLMTYASGRALLAGAVDGKLAGDRSDVTMLVGRDTYRLADSLTPATGASDLSLLDLWQAKSRAVIMSPDTPPTDKTSKNQPILLILGSPSMSGSYRFIQWDNYEILTGSPLIGKLGAANTLLVYGLYAFMALPGRSFVRATAQVTS